MIQITLTFLTLDAARKALLELPESAIVQGAPSVVEAPAPAPKPEKPAKAVKPAPEPEAAPPQPTAAPEVAPAPVAAPAAPEPGIDYPTLQKAVFALVAKNRDLATQIAAGFGVRTFKELDASRWGDALVAVNTALSEME